MPNPNPNKQRSYNGDYMVEARFAEEVILRWLNSWSNVVSVEDVREDKGHQEREIDFVVHKDDGSQKTVEVKSDRHLGVNNNNLLFEMLRLNLTCDADKVLTVGWSARTEADCIIFYASSIEKIYVFDAKDYKRCYQQWMRSVYQQSQNVGAGLTRPTWIPTDNIKATLIGLIPYRAWKGIGAKVYDAQPHLPEAI